MKYIRMLAGLTGLTVSPFIVGHAATVFAKAGDASPGVAVHVERTYAEGVKSRARDDSAARARKGAGKGRGPEDVQGVTLKCEGLKAGGNPLEGLNINRNRPKTKKQKEAEVKCKVVSP